LRFTVRFTITFRGKRQAKNCPSFLWTALQPRDIFPPPAHKLSELLEARGIIMARLSGIFPIVLTLAASGCIGEDSKNALVPSDPLGNGMTAASQGSATRTVSRTSSINPAPAESAARVDRLGRNILAANHQIGLRPQFMVIGSPQPEIFHKQGEALYVTDGLVKQCKTDGELAAVLCHELGKMVSDREVQRGPQAKNQRIQPPPEARIGNEAPGSYDSADRTRLAELAIFEQERRESARPLPPPNPNLLARTYLQRAGFTEADLRAAQPLLQAANGNMTFEKQMVKPPSSSWAN
jgi:hypothetical protein